MKSILLLALVLALVLPAAAAPFATINSTNYNLSGAVDVITDSIKATYTVNIQGAAPVSANYVLAAIEAGTVKISRLKRIIIWNAGSVTTAQKTNFSIWRETTASSGGTAVTPNQFDTSDTAFSGVARTTGPTAGTLGSAALFQFSAFTPATLGAFTPVVIDLNTDLFKSVVLPAGPAAGIIIRVDNGAAGYANLDITLVFTEE